MSAALARPGWLTPRVVAGLLLAALVAAMALDTTYRDASEPRAGARERFDPARYGRETFPRVVATLDERAVALDELLPALREDEAAAGRRYGHREGTSAYNFAVRGEGVAGKATGGLLPVDVRGVPSEARVSIQIGPAINGTALRDAVGFISFNKGFVNQVEYSQAATALNDQVKARVLSRLDAARLEGERIAFLGAFTLLEPSVVTVTPVRIEDGG